MRHDGGWMGVALVLLVLGAAGCQESTATSSAGWTLGSSTLPTLDEAGLAEALQQRHGKLVLVDFWATWCEPCKRLFPHTVQLQQRWAAEGLAVIAVSLDNPDAEGEAAAFLTQEKAEFANYRSRYGASPQSIQAFAIPEGGLPHLRLYDRQGKLVRSFDLGQFQPRDIEQAVEALLAPGR